MESKDATALLNGYKSTNSTFRSFRYFRKVLVKPARDFTEKDGGSSSIFLTKNKEKRNESQAVFIHIDF